MHRFSRYFLIAAASLGCLLPGVGVAESAAQSPLRIVVPQAPGGGTDIVARLLAPGLSKELGQTVVVDNRPGASGQIGTQHVQGAAPDGSTVLFAVDHSLIVVPLTVPGVRYDVQTDFVPLGQAVRTEWVLSVPADAAYQGFAEYVAGIKGEPRLRSYGVPLLGGAATVMGDAIGRHAGVEMVAVPFSGSAPVMQNVMAAQVPAGITGLPEAVRAHRNGSAKILAVSGTARTAHIPEVPTFHELGLEGLEFHTFMGFFAPKGVPDTVALEFNDALRKVLATPDVQDRIDQISLQAAPTTLDEAAREVAELSEFWKRVLPPQQ